MQATSESTRTHLPADAEGPRASAESKHTILLVEDAPAVRNVLERVLTRAGHAVVTAADGAEAYRLLEAQAFDVVVSDISMPRVDGLELLRRVRARDSELPVILLTGAPTTATAIGAVNLCATAYLQKPLAAGTLVAEVEKALKLRQLARVRREAASLLAAARGSEVSQALSATLDRALSGLFMAYQPIVSWSRRAVVAYEAFVRSSEPALAYPAALFDAAERLDRLPVLGRAIRANCAGAFAESDPRLHLFVNVRPTDLLDPALYDVDEPLRHMAARVVFEITERARIDEVSDISKRTATLRDLGFRLAVDDIGGGYAGLNSFASLHPEFVKLDLALVRDIDRDFAKKRVARMLIDLCTDMNIAVIGEGVETSGERDALISIGCDLLQGYLFARPGAPFPAPEW